MNPDHLSYFHFVGRILGIAVFHGHCLDAGFTLPFYKQLLNKPITLQDIEGVDPELHRSLTWMLENSITGVIESTFSVENNSFGVLKVHELKPNGQQIVVTEDNKREYVKLYVNYRFMRGIEQQFLALQKGRYENIDIEILYPKKFGAWLKEFNGVLQNSRRNPLDFQSQVFLSGPNKI